MNMPRFRPLAISLLLLFALLLSSCGSASSFFTQTAPVEGSRAPDFRLRTLDGDIVQLSDYRGQVVLVNFWATWCAPCRQEMPDIQQRFEEGNFAVLAVNFNEDPELVSAFVDELGLSFPVLLDPGAAIQKVYQVRGYPTSFFIDEEGVIRIMHLGIMDAATLDANLQAMGVLN